MAATTQETQAQAQWHAAYPVPKADVVFLTREEVLALLQDPQAVAGKDYILIDLRRNDHEGGTIQGSINLPAQSLWPTIPTVYQLFKSAGVRKVIFYCGSSSGRGCRAGGWFADHIASQDDKNMQSLVLQGGIKGWVKAGEQFTKTMHEYDSASWQA